MLSLFRQPAEIAEEEIRMSRHILTAHPGLATGIGYYLSGMEEVRHQVRDAVKDLDVEQLGRPAFLGAHSIGALVLHIGEAEWWWMQCNVAGHQLTEEDAKAPYWDVLEEPGAFAKKGYTAEFCLREVDNIRNQTRDLLFGYADKDLERIVTVRHRGKTRDHNLRWVLHHMIDHEAHHKGQIMMLKRIMAIP
jgi:uncharacterized damage-inducible protein DinB